MQGSTDPRDVIVAALNRMAAGWHGLIGSVDGQAVIRIDRRPEFRMNLRRTGSPDKPLAGRAAGNANLPVPEQLRLDGLAKLRELGWTDETHEPLDHVRSWARWTGADASVVADDILAALQVFGLGPGDHVVVAFRLEDDPLYQQRAAAAEHARAANPGPQAPSTPLRRVGWGLALLAGSIAIGWWNGSWVGDHVAHPTHVVLPFAAWAFVAATFSPVVAGILIAAELVNVAISALRHRSPLLSLRAAFYAVVYILAWLVAYNVAGPHKVG